MGDEHSFRDTLDFFRDDIEGFTSDLQNKLDNLDKDRELTEVQINNYFSRVQAEVDNKKECLIRESYLKYEQCRKEFGKRMKAAENILHDFDDLQKDEVDIVAEDLNADFEKLQLRLLQEQKNIPNVYFDENEEDMRSLKKMKFGEVNVVTAAGGKDTNEKQEFSFETASENEIKSNIKLTSLIWHNNLILVTEKTYRKLKVFTNSGWLIHEMVFSDGEPYGLCHTKSKLNEEYFAITIPKKAMIITVKFSDTNLHFERSFMTHVGYAGIARGIKSNTLVTTLVAKTETPRIDIIGYEGEIYKIIEFDSGVPIFVFPRYVLTNYGTIIVSDWKRNCVVFVSEETGAILGEYFGTEDKPLTNPYDITLDKRGFVYVMDGKTEEIHLLNLQCKLVEVFKYACHSFNARLLAFDLSKRRLAISHGTGIIDVVDTKCKRKESAAEETTSSSRRAGVEGLLLPPRTNEGMRCPSPGF